MGDEILSKLLKLKQWLSIEDAAKRLTISAGEDVTKTDILRLAIDGHLTLSVYFVNHARGRPARIEPLGTQHYCNAPLLFEYGPPRYVTIRGEMLPNNEEVLTYEGDEQNPEKLEGVWDLLMLGAECLDVEHAYQQLTGGPAVELICLGGPLVASADRSKIFQILDSYKCPVREPTMSATDWMDALVGLDAVKQPKEEALSRLKYETVYYPAGGLPEGSIFVVRTAALREFEEKQLVDEAPTEKPLHSSERKSIAQIISTLAAMAGLDLSAPYKADETLRAAAAKHRLELPGSPETVTKFLKDAAARNNKN